MAQTRNAFPERIPPSSSEGEAEATRPPVSRGTQVAAAAGAPPSGPPRRPAAGGGGGGGATPPGRWGSTAVRVRRALSQAGEWVLGALTGLCALVTPVLATILVGSAVAHGRVWPGSDAASPLAWGALLTVMLLVGCRYPWARFRWRLLPVWRVLCRLGTLGVFIHLLAVVGPWWIEVTADAGPILRGGLRFAAVASLAWVGLRLALLFDLVSTSLRLYGSTDLDAPDEGSLLSAQRRFVDVLESRASDMGPKHEGQIVAVRGGWGTGKSFLLRILRRRLEAREIPVIWIDVWREQSDPDLQREVLNALLAHPRLLFPDGYWSAPLSLLAHRAGGLCRRFVPRFRLPLVKGAVVEVRLGVPLRWQEEVEQVLAGRRVVVVLDEIDRAVPGVAQAALTLAKRSLNLPGVAVVVPFVPEQITFKAFNPLQPAVTTDLHQTTMAVLFRDKERAGFSKRELDQLLAEALPSPGGPPSSTPRSVASASLSPMLRAILARHYLSVKDVAKERLIRRFTEKYLVGGEHAVPPISLVDLPEVLRRFRDIRGAATKWPHIDETALEEVASGLQSALGKVQNYNIPRLRDTSIRQIVGCWTSVLARVPEGAGSRETAINLMRAALCVGLYKAQNTA